MYLVFWRIAIDFDERAFFAVKFNNRQRFVAEFCKSCGENMLGVVCTFAASFIFA